MTGTEDVTAALLECLGNRASWISALEAARGTGGSWLLRRDLDLAPLLGSGGGDEPQILSAHVVAVSTADVAVLVDAVPVLDVRAVGPAVASAASADVTDAILPGGTRVDHVSLALVHVDGRSDRSIAEVPPAVLAALVLRVRRGIEEWTTDEEVETVVVGTDARWWTAPGPVAFEPREDLGRPPLEVHDAPVPWADEDLVDDLAWTRYGAMHGDASRTWTSAADQGRHPSLVHPPIVPLPVLVEEEDVAVRELVIAPGGVQCLDLGQSVCARPVLALPDGALRPITLWAGPTPGTPPRGGDVRIETHGRAAVLDAHGTARGRWLHVHGSPDLEAEDVTIPVRRGVLPRPFGVDLSDELVSLLLSDALASLQARAQERYLGDAGTPLLAEIARTARAALLAGADTWRSARGLEVFLATARSVPDGMVVDAIAPEGPVADLDEHTFSLPGWIADHAVSGSVPRGAGRVLGGISARLHHRLEHGPSPADRMDTTAAALDALDGLARLARRGGEDPAPHRAAIEALRAQARATLRATRSSGGRGTWLEARGDAASTARATALAALAGLVDPEDAPFSRTTLRAVIAEDPEGLIRAALVRLGEGRAVIDAHRDGDDVPPVVLSEVLAALTGLTFDGDRVHLGVPSLPVEGVDLDLAHPRGDVRIRWEGGEGTAEVPEGAHLLVTEAGASDPVWYNSGTTAVRRPWPSAGTPTA